MSLVGQMVSGRTLGKTREGTAGKMAGKRSMVSQGGFIAGVEGDSMRLPGNPTFVSLFDDFIGDVLADQWNAVEGDTDGTEVVLAGGIGGVLRLTSGNDDANGTQATDAAGVNSYLNWQAANGGLEMQARVKMSRITDAYLFVGFTDTVAHELPIIAAGGGGNALTSNASDAVGFLFDTNMLADKLWLVGVKADVDAAAQNTALAPVANDYITLRLEVGIDGRTVFYVNGVAQGVAMANALTAATDLTPVVYVSNADGTTPVTLDVDYLYTSMIRAADGDAT
jgi:hypothetical protein